MAKQRRLFSTEFKKEAVERSYRSGQTVQQVASDLGITAGLLGKWRRLYRDQGEKAFPGRGNARAEEVARLKRELAQVKRERDFLKDAAAYFAKESR